MLPNPSQVSPVLAQGFKLKSNNKLIICPPNTFRMDDWCYTNPFISVSVFYTMQFNNDTGEVSHILNSEKSQIIPGLNQTQDIKRLWQFSDPILQKIADAQPDAEKIVIPQNALRLESTYSVTFTATNEAVTFIETATIDFIPISCQILVEKTTGLNYMEFESDEPQETEDIVFDISKLAGVNSCADGTHFYNSLDLDKSYFSANPNVFQGAR